MNEVDQLALGIRAQGFDPFGLEMLAVVLAASIFLTSRRSLSDLWLVCLPFTDIIYRVWDLSPSDIVSTLIVVRFLSSNRLPPLGSTISLFLMAVFFSAVYGLLQYGQAYGLLYTMKLTITIAATACLVHGITIEDLVNYRTVIGRLAVISVLVAALQILLFLLGYSTAGVFYGFGSLRAKSLAHEPATFAFWLVFAAFWSMPLLTRGSTHAESLSKPLLIPLLSIVFGLLLTASITAVGSLLSGIAVGSLILFAQRRTGALKVLHRVLWIAVISICLYFIVAPESFEYISSKVASFVVEYSGGDTDIESGRGGDFYLLELLARHPWLGIGAFSSSQLSLVTEGGLAVGHPLGTDSSFVPATNTFLTLIAELGVPLGLIAIFSLCRIFWMPFRSREPFTIVCYAFSVVLFIYLAGLRILGFPYLWLILLVLGRFNLGLQPRMALSTAVRAGR